MYLRHKVYMNFQVLLSKNINQLKTKLYDFLCQKVHVYVVLVAELLTLRKTKISVIWIYMHTKLIVCYSCKDTWMVSIMGKRHIHFLLVLMEAVGTIAFPQFSSQQAWWRQMLAKVTVSIKDAESILRKITFFFVLRIEVIIAHAKGKSSWLILLEFDILGRQ